MPSLNRLWAPVTAALFMLPAVPAAAAPEQITLPPVTAKFREVDLPGYRVAIQKCTICHSPDYVNYQPPGMSQAQWTAEMHKMQHSYGAPIDEVEIGQLGAYLAVAYGSAKITDAAVVAASSPPATPPAPGAGHGADATALLTQNACLGCHALDHKVVGPAYRDVARKYAGDPQALSKVEASIRSGGVGKWGEVPMPPFANLSADDLKALAEFVLHQ